MEITYNSNLSGELISLKNAAPFARTIVATGQDDIVLIPGKIVHIGFGRIRVLAKEEESIQIQSLVYFGFDFEDVVRRTAESLTITKDLDTIARMCTLIKSQRRLITNDNGYDTFVFTRSVRNVDQFIIDDGQFVGADLAGNKTILIAQFST